MHKRLASNVLFRKNYRFNMINFLLPILFFWNVIVLSNNSNPVSNFDKIADSALYAKAKVLDSLYKYNDSTLQSRYIEILEKTNSQVSLWGNPYGLFIAFLGILFTIAAVFAGFYLYAQTKEFKERVQSAIDSGTAAINKVVEEKSQIILDSDKIIEEQKQMLTEAGEKERIKIKELIKDSQEKKSKAQTELSATTSAVIRNLLASNSNSVWSGGIASVVNHGCSKCNTKFDKTIVYNSSTPSYEFQCPNCKNIDYMAFLRIPND